jgi:hypothetical protein
MHVDWWINDPEPDIVDAGRWIWKIYKDRLWNKPNISTLIATKSFLLNRNMQGVKLTIARED